MRKRAWGWIAVVGILGLLGLGSGAWAQEVELKLDQVPKAVLDSAKAKFPGARHREAARETEEGKTVYEIAMTHEGHRMDVTFQEDGTLVLVETEVPEAELPAAVLKAAQDKYPGAKIKLAESVKKGPKVKKDVDYYELHLTTADKKSAELEVDSRGKILKSATRSQEEGEEKEGQEKD
jgi:uncharacterized membrane protein YkoI